MSDGRVTLDQLMSGSPEPPRRRVPRPVRSAIAAIFIAVAILLYLRALNLEVPYWLIFSAMLAVMLLRHILAAVRVEPLPDGLRSPAWGVVDDADHGTHDIDGLQRAVQRWETRLSWSENDNERFEKAVRTRLAALVDERLRQRHSIGLATDPVRAHAIVGAELWTFLHQPARRPYKPADLAALVARMEKI